MPSIFKFPDHLSNKLKRKPPVSYKSIHIRNDNSTFPSPSKKLSTSTSPTKEELRIKISEQKKKIKVLQQKVRRKEKKISSLTELFADLTSRKLINNDAASRLNENFSGLILGIDKKNTFIIKIVILVEGDTMTK